MLMKANVNICEIIKNLKFTSKSAKDDLTCKLIFQRMKTS